MSNPVESVQTNKAVKARVESLSGKPSEPGTLTQWADDEDNRYWEFVGNGKTTGTELMTRVVEHEAQAPTHNQTPSGLSSFANDPSFARHAAESLLADGDPKYNADAPIAQGQVKEIPLKSLLALVGPFLQQYAAQVRNNDGTTPAPAGSEGDQRKMLGLTHSVGLTLPIDF